MRRTAALVAFLSLLPHPARAGGSGLVLQLGPVSPLSGHVNHVAMMIDGVYAPSPLGGVWLEFGVLERDLSPALFQPEPPATDGTVLSTGGSGNPGSDQVLEVTTGFVLGPSGSDFLYPYLKAGIGAYRDRPLASPVRFAASDFYSPYYTEQEMQWDMGLSVGVGARVGRPGSASPTIEARIHLTRLDGQDTHQLLVVSGGIWFR
jgi:hypothetical protein